MGKITTYYSHLLQTKTLHTYTYIDTHTYRERQRQNDKANVVKCGHLTFYLGKLFVLLLLFIHKSKIISQQKVLKAL